MPLGTGYSKDSSSVKVKQAKGFHSSVETTVQTARKSVTVLGPMMEISGSEGFGIPGIPEANATTSTPGITGSSTEDI